MFTPFQLFQSTEDPLKTAKKWAEFGYRLRIENRLMNEEDIAREVERAFYNPNKQPPEQP